MNLKILILKILISLLVMSGNVFAKAVPPGSGQGDVPANILILLDKSGSMSARLGGGTGISYPEGMAIDSSGDLYGAQYYTYGIRKYKYKVTPINWTGRIKGTSKFKIKELRSKYLFTLIYCFIEKNLLNIKK